MNPPEVLLPNSGPQLESHEKQSSASYPARKRRPSKEPEILSAPSMSGFESSTTKKMKSALEKKSGLPVPKKLPKPVDRVQQALGRLGVDPQTLKSSPEITPMLKNAQGGLKAVLGTMRFSCDDPTIRAFLDKYDSVPSGDREKISWEAIALAAGIDLRVFLGSAMLALQSQAVNMVKIIAMTSHPKITKARVKYGLLPSGEKDRTALDTAMGFLPSPKGPTFIGKAIFGSGGGEGSGTYSGDTAGGVIGVNDAEDPDLNDLFPSANTIQQKLIPIRQRMLEDGK